MRIARVLLVIIAVVCLGVALSYPIRYREAQEKNDSDMETLAQMRQKARQSQSLDLPQSFTEQGLPGGRPEDRVRTRDRYWTGGPGRQPNGRLLAHPPAPENGGEGGHGAGGGPGRPRRPPPSGVWKGMLPDGESGEAAGPRKQGLDRERRGPKSPGKGEKPPTAQEGPARVPLAGAYAHAGAHAASPTTGT